MENDDLTLTIRLHDPAEKDDAAKAAVWVTGIVHRADLKLSASDFAERYLKPAAMQLLGPHN